MPNYQYNYIFTIVGKATIQASYGEGSGTIAMENVACFGTETDLFACKSSPIFDIGTCTHDEDAGVVCEGEFVFVN